MPEKAFHYFAVSLDLGFFPVWVLVLQGVHVPDLAGVPGFVAVPVFSPDVCSHYSVPGFVLCSGCYYYFLVCFPDLLCFRFPQVVDDPRFPVAVAADD